MNETNKKDDVKPESRSIDTPPQGELLAENRALRQMIRLRDAREELTAALNDRGARSAGLLFAYAVDDLQFDDENKLANASALVRKLERSFPEQFEQRPAVPSINGGAGAANQPVAITRESLSNMKPAEIAALDWNEVKRVLAAQ
ncbi:MAG TPA: hypothetical protein VL325_05225 [Pyrinomonadaceae bacterium]|nr:hypothetical protein [Pyrinomonadaceae bacterium]